MTTAEPKKTNKLSKQLAPEQNHRNGDHSESYQRGGEGERMWLKYTGNKKHNWQVQNRQQEGRNRMGNGEAKEYLCHGYE